MEMENTYENIQDKNRNTVGPQTQSQNPTEAQSSRRWFVVITVCLGLICVLLVIALIVQYIHLTAERDQMKMRNMNIAEEYNSLKVNYSRLNDEKDSLSQKKLELEANYSRLTDERDQLKKNLTYLSEMKLELEVELKMYIKRGRYFISNEMKSWSDSRRFCRDRGGDLIIINTEEEQRFISSIITETMWIGLSDIENEGVMQWVGNTTVDVKFWISGEPNDAHGDEDCVHIVYSYPPDKNWNDQPCAAERPWICEN